MSPNTIHRPSFEREATIPVPEAIDVLREDNVAGMRIERVRASDGFEAHNPERREALQEEMDEWDLQLRRHPEWQMPQQDSETRLPIVDPANKASAWFYATESQQAWGALMPTALALYPLQRPESASLPNGVPIDERSREFFMHSIDAIGIRTRAEIMTGLSLQSAAKQEGKDLKWVSIACGAAVPVLNAVSQIKEEFPDKEPHLKLVDIDPNALAFAKKLAEEHGLEEGRDFTTRRSNIFKELHARDTLVQEIGPGSAQMVDALGIFEYLPDNVASSMLQKMHQLAAPGGSVVIGNMLDDRRQLDFNRRAVGWPKIYPRSLEELTELVTSAGIDINTVTAYIPEDGVYAVISIEKPYPELSGQKALLGNMGQHAVDH
ncbi:MAG TPA: class I SAM-dependent methyltransferase family protein [Candidatus Saccharimonadales bacterium]